MAQTSSAFGIFSVKIKVKMGLIYHCLPQYKLLNPNTLVHNTIA